MGGVNFGSEPYLVKIGDHVTVSSGVFFVTHDGGSWVYRDKEEGLKGATAYGPIRIYDNCFIGANSIIMPGVRIGSNSVVGAGAVVAKDVEPNSVVGGVPARKIMSYDEYVQKAKRRGQFVTPNNKKAVLLEMFGDFLR
jgi:acetyltransferase-like isoleucine patch superfamily enzyme